MTQLTGNATVHEDAAELAAAVASRLLARLEEAQGAGRVPHVALTGGSIADEIHREVARRAPDSSVDWQRVELWFGDERFVSSRSSDRNALQAREAMIDALGVPPERVHEAPGSDQVDDVQASALAYAQALHEHGADEFELVMLGLGPDGHVASLFPGHPGLEAHDAVTVAVTDSPKPPPERVSLTLEALNRSRAVWFVVSGDQKAGAVADALAPGPARPTSPQSTRHPAREVAGRVETVWFLDQAAASQL